MEERRGMVKQTEGCRGKQRDEELNRGRGNRRHRWRVGQTDGKEKRGTEKQRHRERKRGTGNWTEK